jgi:hypothetical protein
MHCHETTEHSSGTCFFVFVNFPVTIQALSAFNKSLFGETLKKLTHLEVFRSTVGKRLFAIR